MANEKMLCGLGGKNPLGVQIWAGVQMLGPLIYTLQHVSLWSLNDFVLYHMAAENNHQKLSALFSNYT